MVDIFLHLDVYLALWMDQLGPWIYVLAFAVIFCETGLVITPFLPGDSFLFALGALTTTHSLSLSLLLVILFAASVAGDFVNYLCGSYFGEWLIQQPRLLNPKHLKEASRFFNTHGGKAIVLARFLPVVRTFVPFTAGMGKMEKSSFAFYNMLGGGLWTFSFLLLGHFFGALPVVKSQFHYVIFGIILVSLLPLVYGFIKTKGVQSE